MTRNVLCLGLGLLAASGMLACQDSTSDLLTPELRPQFAKPPSCRLRFDLVLDESGTMRGDVPTSPYSDGVDGVMASTDGTGLRFDTNRSQELERADDSRRVRLDFTGTGYEVHANPTELKGIDLRFDGKNNPINLCNIPIGGSGIVPAMVSFVSSSTGGRATLSYAMVNMASDPDDDCAARGVSRLTVTRETSNVWNVTSGPTACFYSGFLGGVFRDVIAMPISFRITAQ